MSTASLLPIGFSLLGVGGLRFAWRGKERRHQIARWGSWLSLLLAILCWSAISGAEFGVSFALLAFSLVALVFLGFNATVKPGQNAKPAVLLEEVNSSRLRKCMTFLVVGPLLGFTSGYGTLVFMLILPFSTSTQLVVASFLYPTLWAIFAFLVCARDRKLADALVMLAVLGLSIGYLQSAAV